MTSVLYDTGKQVDYTYDGRDLLVQVDDWTGGTTTMAYDDAGRRTSITRPNGVITTIAYDSNGKITSIDESDASTTLSNISLVRDERGLITSSTRAVPLANDAGGAAQGSLAYDAASQALRACYGGRAGHNEPPREQRVHEQQDRHQ